MAERDGRMDNMRAVLIWLVVFCHLLVEVSEGPLTGLLYQVVYVFHMPAFAFVTGYFARFRPRRMLWGLAWPYAFFQVLATARRNVVAGRLWVQGMTLLVPQWTLWYLLACLVWTCGVPLLEHARALRRRVSVVVGLHALALGIGFVPWVGELLDLSRIVVLLPFFAAGYYAGRMGLSLRMAGLDPVRLRQVRLATTAVVAVAMAVHFAHGRCPKQVLYRDTAYASLWDCEARLIMQLAATAWCAWLMAVVPTRDMGTVSMVGRNTMSIYLLHTWAIRLLRHVLALPGSEPVLLAWCVVLDCAIMLLLGNDVVGRAFRLVFGGGWLESRARTNSEGSHGEGSLG